LGGGYIIVIDIVMDAGCDENEHLVSKRKRFLEGKETHGINNYKFAIPCI
jgi:hypothetical protein